MDGKDPKVNIQNVNLLLKGPIQTLKCLILISF